MNLIRCYNGVVFNLAHLVTMEVLPHADHPWCVMAFTSAPGPAACTVTITVHETEIEAQVERNRIFRDIWNKTAAHNSGIIDCLSSKLRGDLYQYQQDNGEGEETE